MREAALAADPRPRPWRPSLPISSSPGAAPSEGRNLPRALRGCFGLASSDYVAQHISCRTSVRLLRAAPGGAGVQPVGQAPAAPAWQSELTWSPPSRNWCRPDPWPASGEDRLVVLMGRHHPPLSGMAPSLEDYSPGLTCR